jgi:hypothetical protein
MTCIEDGGSAADVRAFESEAPVARSMEVFEEEAPVSFFKEDPAASLDAERRRRGLEGFWREHTAVTEKAGSSESSGLKLMAGGRHS